MYRKPQQPRIIIPHTQIPRRWHHRDQAPSVRPTTLKIKSREARVVITVAMKTGSDFRSDGANPDTGPLLQTAPPRFLQARPHHRSWIFPGTIPSETALVAFSALFGEHRLNVEYVAEGAAAPRGAAC